MQIKSFIPKNRIIQVVLAILLLTVCVRFYFRITDDFRIANITYPIPYHPEWEVPPLSQAEKESLDAILNQKFSYIGKGAQSYAFGSDDGNYVLKFFKFKHLKPSLFVDYLPPIGPLDSYKTTQIARKARKLESVFVGYRLGYAVHKNESGLIYLQLNPNQGHMNKNVIVRDKLGFERSIDLDSVVFILQEKAKTTRTVVNELLQKGDMQGVKARIGQIFNLYVLEYSKGIYDRDHGVMHNTGFVNDKPIHLDIGKLTLDERMKLPEFYQPDLILIGNKFARWLKENYPKEFPEIASDMEAKISAIFGKPFAFEKK